MTYAIEMKDITKDFFGIRANDAITIQVKENTIHALLGENGAGKSTLMSILFGLYQPTSGKIYINQKEVQIRNPNDANRLGIGMVHQHFKLVESFTVCENIILGMEPKGKFSTLDMKKSEQKVKELSERYHLNVDPLALISEISVAMQQRVEILKMLYRDAQILIFDEPSAVLTPQEIRELMKIMKNLVQEGKTILLITHKLKEIKQIADECTILRKGKCIGCVHVPTTSEAEMAKMMVGREVNFKIEKEKANPQDIILELKHLSVRNQVGHEALHDFSLNIHAGEIVGLAGIDGNGQKELVEVLLGLRKLESGEMKLKGKDFSKLSIKKRLNEGIAYVLEDRHKYGLVLDFKLKENFILHNYAQTPFSKHYILQNKAICEYALRLIQEFDIRSSQGCETITRNMSGGNQQKAIIAREIDRFCELLVIVQPTRGLDVGAIEYIHSRIIEQRNRNFAVLLISFELDEIMNLSDRIAVIHNGQLAGLVDVDQVNECEIGLMMSGVKKIEATL
ncbi:MAG: ABC transporter ATP-binding protein [Traorella sp.]